MGRYGLLIAAGEYEDQTLHQLRAPHQDVDRLAAILEDPEVGGFTSVTVLRDTADYQLRMAIEEMLTGRLRDDLVLVYFSCHGIVDGQHRLYFATTNTRHMRPAGTAVSRTFVNEQLEACTAGAKVLILDCCYSGAFAEGFKSAPMSALEGQAGRGYVVLAASDAYEYAYEADSVTDAAPRASAFTDVMIEGLSSGAADLDHDHRIGVDELFRYVQAGVRRRSPNQTPRFWANDAELNIYLATVSHPAPAVAAAAVGAAREAGAGEMGTAARLSSYNRNQVIVARGLRAASDQIRLMLGPLGRRVPVADEDAQYAETGDTHAFVTLYRPGDPQDRLGASYAAEIVEQAHRQAGDGAATAVVLAQAMVEGAVAALRAGAHPMALASGVEAGVTAAIEALKPLTRDLETLEQVSAFAGMAASDPRVGEIIAKAMDMVGKAGVVTVRESSAAGAELEIIEGMYFDEGYLSPHFCTDPERREAVLSDPYVLLADQEISVAGDLLPVLAEVQQSGKPLLIIAKNVEGQALATLIANKMNGKLKSAAVKAPGLDGCRQDFWQDLAILTGGRVISPGTGVRLAAVTLDLLGRTRKVVVTRDATIITGGAGTPDSIGNRIGQIRAEIEKCGSGHDRQKMQERLAKLAGGTAVIRVGATTEARLAGRKARYERAVLASRTAFDEGLLPGGGTSLCAVATAVAATADNSDRGTGVLIVAGSLDAPYAQILANAGIPARTPAGAGINALSGAPADLFAAGIFDSAGALRSALEAARQATIRFLRVA
ncbi:MAG TPA: chaperonin GroEL [Streptosporangiaceae bacterium]|nr:chaperonin GroEL [Streptosporangiaceae bacterium]